MRAGDRLWAIGDVTGRGAFTHMSMYQADIAASDILGAEPRAADYRAVPRVTFTDPEVERWVSLRRWHAPVGCR